MVTEHIIVLNTQKPPEDLAHGSILFVGNATTVLHYAGFSILTDPNFLHMGDHAHLGYGLRSQRITNPAVPFENLPPYDFVLLSHLHEDHFDRNVERKLPKRTMIVTTPHAAKILRTKGFRNTQALPTWTGITIRKGDYQLRITSMPGRHGPGLIAKALPDVMGSLLEFQTLNAETHLSIYISGDTLVHKDLKQIPERYPDIDLGLFHLGGTKIMGLLVTMDAKQGVEAIKIINPKEAIPIHYEEYTVMKSPLSDFRELVEKAGLGQKVRYMERGEALLFEGRKKI